MNQIVIFRPGALGDTLLAFPALAALRRARPDALLSVIGNAPALALARDAGLADEIFSFDLPCWAGMFAEEGIQAPEARRALEWADLAVLWLRDAEGLAARNLRAAGARQIIGAPGRPAEGQRVHTADHLLTTLAPALGAARPAGSGTVPLALAPEAREWAGEEWTRRVLAGERVLALHPGSGGRQKCWPPECYAALAERFLADGWWVLLLEGPADEEAVEQVQAELERLPKSGVFVPGRAGRLRGAASRGVFRRGGGVGRGGSPDALPNERVQRVTHLALPQLAALLVRVDLFVGNDSGVSHLSAAVGTPTLALFGPTDPAVWAPRGPRVGVLWAGQVVAGKVVPGQMTALGLAEVWKAARAWRRRSRRRGGGVAPVS